MQRNGPADRGRMEHTEPRLPPIAVGLLAVEAWSVVGVSIFTAKPLRFALVTLTLRLRCGP